AVGLEEISAPRDTECVLFQGVVREIAAGTAAMPDDERRLESVALRVRPGDRGRREQADDRRQDQHASDQGASYGARISHGEDLLRGVDWLGASMKACRLRCREDSASEALRTPAGIGCPN